MGAGKEFKMFVVEVETNSQLADSYRRAITSGSSVEYLGRDCVVLLEIPMVSSLRRFCLLPAEAVRRLEE